MSVDGSNVSNPTLRVYPNSGWMVCEPPVEEVRVLGRPRPEVGPPLPMALPETRRVVG